LVLKLHGVSDLQAARFFEYLKVDRIAANADNLAQQFCSVAAHAVAYGVLDNAILGLSYDHISKDGFDSSFHNISSLSSDITVVFA